MAEEFVTDIEHDLAELLAVEPSPEFRPRIRARIDLEPRRVQAGWRWAALATAAVVVVMAISVALLRPDGDSSVTAPSFPHGIAVDVRLSSNPVTPVRNLATPHPRPTTQVRRAPSAPVVLVDQAQADAVRRLLVVAARAPRFSPIELPAESPTPAVSPLSVDPMLVDPVRVPELTRDNKGVQQ